MPLPSDPFSAGAGHDCLDLNSYAPNWGTGKWPMPPQYVLPGPAGDQSQRIAALERWQLQAQLEIAELKEQVKVLKSLLGGPKLDSLIPNRTPSEHVGPSSLSPLSGPSPVDRRLSGELLFGSADPLKNLPDDPWSDGIPASIGMPMVLERSRTEPKHPSPALAPPPMMSLARSTSDGLGESSKGGGSLHGQIQEQLIKEGPDSPSITRMTWRIDNVRTKLKSCAGKALVSPPFEALGIPDMRLMVFPSAEQNRGLKTREQKAQYENMINVGPLHCALRLKVVSVGKNSVLTFTLFVGSVKHGPMVHDFAEHIIHGCDDFKMNWLDQIDETSGSMTVGVELCELTSKEDAHTAFGSGSSASRGLKNENLEEIGMPPGLPPGLPLPEPSS
jgi:hypothetical protein